MKIIKHLWLLTAVLILGGCVADYDDSALNGKLDQLTDRVEKLEFQVQSLNKDIVSLKDLITKVENNIYVNKIEEITGKDGLKGYRITFTDNSTAEIFNGAPATAPEIGVKKAADGKYYWTVDGEFLTADGKRMPVLGEKGEAGKDAVAPEIRINPQTGMWEISTDKGRTWESTGIQASGKDGDSFFQDIRENEKDVDFVLADGSIIKVPKGSMFAIHLSEKELYMDAGQTASVTYTLDGADTDTFVQAYADNGYIATVDEEKKIITVTAPVPAQNSTITIIYSNGEDKTVISRILIKDLSAMPALDIFVQDGDGLKRVSGTLDFHYDIRTRTYLTTIAVRSRFDWKLQANASRNRLFLPESGIMQGDGNFKAADTELPRFTLICHPENNTGLNPEMKITDLLEFVKNDGSDEPLASITASAPAKADWPATPLAPLIANTYLYPMWKNHGTLPAVPNTLNNMSQFTMECLLNPGAFTGQIQSIMGIEDLFLARIYDGESLNTNQLEIVVRSATNEPIHLNDWQLAFEEVGRWYHLAIVADLPAGNIKCYIDGQLISEFKDDFVGSVNFWTDFEEEYKLPHSFFIGRSYDNTRPFQGLMAEVRIWNTCLSAQELQDPNHPYIVDAPEKEEHLLSYWKLNEGKGTEFKDWSRFGNNLKCQNAPAQWIPITIN